MRTILLLSAIGATGAAVVYWPTKGGDTEPVGVVDLQRQRAARLMIAQYERNIAELEQQIQRSIRGHKQRRDEVYSGSPPNSYENRLRTKKIEELQQKIEQQRRFLGDQ